MSKYRSIIEELNQISIDRDRNHVVENRGEHVIRSAINLIEQMERHYDAETAKDLTNRLINSIKGKDGTKFSRGIKKIIKENMISTVEQIDLKTIKVEQIYPIAKYQLKDLHGSLGYCYLQSDFLHCLFPSTRLQTC